MRLTLVHPCIGRRRGERYLRSWQMEPLQPALLAGLTPSDVELRFHDDRMETIPYDLPTDLVAISVETYTARRAYQIASEYRRRGVPVLMGGFHASLVPDEVARYAECVVVGEAEALWPAIVDDARHRRLAARYDAPARPSLAGLRYDRRVFQGKRYLPLGLVESARGCPFRCEFCAVQSFFDASHRPRPVDEVVAEVASLRDDKRLFFFVDDNFAGSPKAARPLLEALAPLDVRWVTQMSIHAAHDEEFLALLAASGCRGVLIGFESVRPETLRGMGKRFNTMRGGYSQALANLRRHRIRVYGTFVFGYDGDGEAEHAAAVELAIEERFYIAAFNHLTPFPGTPLYQRLAEEGRLLHAAWWLDPDYRYNRVPFRPHGATPEAIEQRCIDARRRFYSVPSMLRRGLDRTNRADGFMARNFWPINWLHRREIGARHHFPLGDAAVETPLLPV
ncbi:MAG: B12-binding domain-containing radical SAM protein [Ectothiorhodospiraceae bacterium]|nr:B12-binding domain-containing radical SAM protein [Ectothiorhodospiraceae bacterium]